VNGKARSCFHEEHQKVFMSGFLALDSRSLRKIDIKKGVSAMVKSGGPEH